LPYVAADQVTVTFVLSNGALADGVWPAPIVVAAVLALPLAEPDHAAALGPARASATVAAAASTRLIPATGWWR
jgi:hypothetical protein